MADRAFGTFWLGQTVSLFGSQVTFLALPLTAILVLRASPFQMGVLGAIELAPFLFLTLLVGAWVDRIRRQPVLLAANALRALLVTIVPLSAAMGLLSFGLLAGVALLVGACAVCFEVAYLAYIPSLVGRDRLASSNARLFASSSAAEVAGPGLAGVLVSVVGAPFALVADAASYVVSAVSLASIRRPEPSPARAADRNLRAEIAEGLRATFGQPVLRAFAFEAATFNLFVNVLNAAFLLFLTRELGFEPALVGTVLAVGAVGSLAGSLVAGRIARRFDLGTTILGAMVAACSVYLVIPFLGGPVPVAAGMLAAVMAVAGAGISVTVIHVMTIRQTITPDRMLARMNASYRTLGYGLMPIGSLLGGAIGEAFGLRAALMVGAVGIASAPLWVVFSPARRIRTIEDVTGQAEADVGRREGARIPSPSAVP
jgi:predicted MFS family arabinose efflux permease